MTTGEASLVSDNGLSSVNGVSSVNGLSAATGGAFTAYLDAVTW